MMTDFGQRLKHGENKPRFAKSMAINTAVVVFRGHGGDYSSFWQMLLGRFQGVENGYSANP